MSGSAFERRSGPPGATGATGATGASGAGFTGATGPAGLDGLDGPRGYTGPSGAAGTTGATGIGTTGATGVQGTTGPTGPQGVDGLDGGQGVTGATGTQGTTGPTGTAGTVGATGTAGTAGATGSTGPQGLDGLEGDRGFTGATGAAGGTGNTGVQGTTGPTGAAGNTGVTGPAGLDGLDGAQGATGALTQAGIPYTFSTTTTDADPGAGNLRLDNATQNTATTIRADLLDNIGRDWTTLLDTFDDSTNTVKGSIRLISETTATSWITFNVTAVASPSGYRNITVVVTDSSAASPFANAEHIRLQFDRAGDAGATGATGTQGATGTAGAAGASGATGPQGLDGLEGAQGDRGSTGPTGAQGNTGTAGTVGGTGSTGPAGLDGLDGAAGATGITGATGTQGIQGATGTAGTVGATGATGPQGLDGLEGDRGFTGATGTQGAQGATGTAGTVGATGIQGLTGPAGLDGLDGLQGATGPLAGIPYTFSTTTTDADPGAGVLRLSNATQNAATVIRADLADRYGRDWTAVLDTFDDSTANVKGLLRLISDVSPARWLTFSVASLAAPSGYRNITVANISASASSPFSDGEPIRLQFDRTGDAGLDGLDGGPGASGATGATGTAGTQGATGTAGTVGATGSTGPEGTPGLDGRIGSDGATGATGVGTAGATGVQGIQGLDGLDANPALGLDVGVSTLGNTAGSTAIVRDQVVLVGSGVMSLSQSTQGQQATISLLAPATSSLSATGQVSISTNASTISIGVPNPIASYRWIEGPLLMGATQGIGTSGATNTTISAWVMPMTLPNDLAFNNLNLAVHNSFSSASTSISSVNYSYSMGASLGFYTLSGSSMSLVTSYSGSLGLTNATSVNATDLKATARVGMGGSSTTKAITGAANLSNIHSSINSVRQMPLMWSTQGGTLTRGQYWAVAGFSQLTGGAAQGSLSQVGFVSNYSAIGSALNPPRMMGDTASVTSPYPFMGMATLVASTDTLMPVSFNTSKIVTATAIANSTVYQSLWVQIYSSHGT